MVNVQLNIFSLKPTESFTEYFTIHPIQFLVFLLIKILKFLIIFFNF